MKYLYMKVLQSKLPLLLILLLASCGHEEAASDPRAEMIATIKKQEKKMRSSMQLDKAVADSAREAYDRFAEAFPQDSITPDLLFKAAEISTATQEYHKALEYYKQIELRHHKYKLYPESLFLQASLLDNYMERDGEALTVYQKVISSFPGTTYAQDAAAAISHLGKSDAEIIEEFKKKNSK
jgi:TolA-binding protein